MNIISRRRVFLERVRCTWCAFVLNTERKSAFATPCIFVRRAITPIYTPWETHGARVVDSSNGNIMERSERFYEREEDSWYIDDATRMLRESHGIEITKCTIISTDIAHIYTHYMYYKQSILV